MWLIQQVVYCLSVSSVSICRLAIMLDGFEDEKSTRPFRFERNAKANKSCAMYRLLLGSTFVELRQSVAKLGFDPKSLRSVLNRDVKEELVIIRLSDAGSRSMFISKILFGI